MNAKREIIKNKLQSVFLVLIFIGIGAGLGGLLYWAYGDISMVWWVAGIAGVYALIQYFLASFLAIKMSKGVLVEETDPNPTNRELVAMVQDLSSKAGIKMPKVYITPDPSMNAFATGRGPSSSVVAVTKGLLEGMDKDELKAVLAHEISHIKHYDIRLNMMVFALTMLIGMLAQMLIRMSFFGRGNSRNNSGGVIALMGIIAMIVVPVINALISMAISRKREFMADAGAVEITGDKKSAIRMLKKLGGYQPVANQNPAASAMYIANPAKKSKLAEMFSTHPAISARVKALEKL